MTTYLIISLILSLLIIGVSILSLTNYEFVCNPGWFGRFVRRLL